MDAPVEPSGSEKTVWFGIKCQRSSKFGRGSAGEKLSTFVAGYVGDVNKSVTSIFAKKSYEDSAPGFQCELDIPLRELDQLGFKFLDVNVQDVEAGCTPAKNAFTVLMEISRQYKHLPEKRNPLTAKDRLYNDVLDKFGEADTYFTVQQVATTGQRVVGTVCDALWYIDPFHEKLASRSLSVPKPFNGMERYNDWKKSHKREPTMSGIKLTEMAGELSKILMLPWFLAARNSDMRSTINDLLTVFIKYNEYLENSNERVSAAHQSPEPVRSFTDNWSFKIIEVSPDSDVPKCYRYSNLIEALQCSPYKSVDLTNFEPQDLVKRRTWIRDMNLPFAYSIFTYAHGNNLGNLNVVWRQPEIDTDRDSCKDIEIINGIKSGLNVYATRAMRKEFMDLYATATKQKPAILRSMYRFLTGQTFAPDNEVEALVDRRVTEFLLCCDDPELAWDLRKNNGKVKDPRYDLFWKELKLYLDEKSVVHERRRTDTNYMPFAISVADLRQQILDRMEPNSTAPSVSWMRLNFAPANPYKVSAVRYTGEFDVKHRVQQRLLRAQHPDSEYGYTLYLLLKHFAVKWKDHVLMQCLDDKAVIPVGEPGKPTSACQRKHGGSLVTGDRQLLTLDHDYNICGIVPSVCLVVDVPDNVRGSFHQGDVHVTLKEKVLQPSSPLRHSTETVKIVRDECSDDDVNCQKPILIRYTDGGPDHRTTYSSVQMSTIGEFIALDLDMLIACRTAPNQLYNNPAERVMSLLNLGLQNVSLSRSEMEPGFEFQMKSLNSLKSFRGRARDELKNALTLSMNSPLTAVKGIFSRLQRGHGKVSIHDACEPDEMDSIRDAVHIIHSDIDVGKSKDAGHAHMKRFYELHCRQRHYSFQVKKCDLEQVSDCPYCVLNPPRLPDDLYTQLKFLPDPVLDSDGNYKTFDEVYGTETDDSDRPSRLQNPTSTDRDKKFKSLIVAAKVRAFVNCHECGKRRIIYSGARLTPTQDACITRVQEELLYSCGSTLFPGGQYQDTIVVKEGVNCSSPIETQYYAGVVQSFEEICFYCGDIEVIVTSEVLDLRERYSIVRPICATCVAKGYKPSSRNARKTKKQKK